MIVNQRLVLSVLVYHLMLKGTLASSLGIKELQNNVAVVGAEQNCQVIRLVGLL